MTHKINKEKFIASVSIKILVSKFSRSGSRPCAKSTVAAAEALWAELESRRVLSAE